jgi:hypothetical protein
MPEAPCGDSFSVEPRRTERSVEFFATNSCHVPIFVELSFPKLRNLASSESLPVHGSLPPHSRRKLLSLKPIDQYKAWSYESSTSVFFGNSAPHPDPDYLYSFPFAGLQPRRLVQGVGGEATHQGLHHYSFDFVIDGFPAGGFHEKYKNRGNEVVVLHADGTIGLYGHLSAGVPVQEGTRVEVGEVLGLSGNSGYSMGPHLHFEVGVQRQGAESQSIAIRFREDIVPVEGRDYGP